MKTSFSKKWEEGWRNLKNRNWNVHYSEFRTPDWDKIKYSTYKSIFDRQLHRKSWIAQMVMHQQSKGCQEFSEINIFRRSIKLQYTSRKWCRSSCDRLAWFRRISLRGGVSINHPFGPMLDLRCRLRSGIIDF